MAGKLGHLAALLVEPHPAAALLHVEVFDRRADASEGVAHQSDQGAVAEPEQGSGVDRGQELVHLLRREDGGLALADAVLRSPYRMGGVALHDVTRHQPAEEHPDRGQALFDGRLRVGATELLDIRRDVHRRHPGQIPQAFLVTPGGESLDSFEVGAAGVRVADVDGEELAKALPASGRVRKRAGSRLEAAADMTAGSDDLAVELLGNASAGNI